VLRRPSGCEQLAGLPELFNVRQGEDYSTCTADDAQRTVEVTWSARRREWYRPALLPRATGARGGTVSMEALT